MSPNQMNMDKMFIFDINCELRRVAVEKVNHMSYINVSEQNFESKIIRGNVKHTDYRKCLRSENIHVHL